MAQLFLSNVMWPNTNQWRQLVMVHATEINNWSYMIMPHRSTTYIDAALLLQME